MRITADREVCMSAGSCVITAHEVFDQDPDGVVVVASEEVLADQLRSVRNAVTLCPSGALRLVPECLDPAWARTSRVLRDPAAGHPAAQTTPRRSTGTAKIHHHT